MGKGEVDRFYGKILDREHIFRNIHRLYVTAYSKEKEKFIKIDKSGPTPEPKKYYDQHLTIKKARHWNAIVHAVNVMKPAIGWPSGGEKSAFGELMSEIAQKSKADLTRKSIKQVAAKRLQRNKKLKQEVENYRQKLAEFMELYRTTNLPGFRKSLQEFKKIVSRKLTESKYQSFLAKPENIWILGLEYVAVNRHEKAGTEGYPDFVPERFDGFHDVIEFKRPDDEIFQWIGGHWRQSTPLKNGISQLMDYLELYDRNPKGSDAITARSDKYRPNGALVIGDLRGHQKREGLKYALLKHNSFLQRIKIVSFDDLIEQASTVIDKFERESK